MSVEGRANGHRMAKLAEGKANRVLGDWSVEAGNKAREYIVARRGLHITAEDLRAWCYEQGVPKPPSQRAWGGIMLGMKHAGLIVADGYVAAVGKEMNAAPHVRWLVTP